VSRPEARRGGSFSVAAREAELASDREVLLSSLEDLEREHLAGDVDDTDYETLRAGYVARAATTLRAIEQLRLEASAAPPTGGAPTGGAPTGGTNSAYGRLRRALGRRRSRVVLGLVGTCCVLGLIAIAAAHLAGARLPGQYASGSVNLPQATKVHQQLEQASILGSTGKQSAAVALYGTVLAEVPNQPEALTYRGWLIRLAGIADKSPTAVRTGDSELADAAKVAPGYADARALYGISLLEDDGQVRLALAQFKAFLADHPSSELLSLLGPDMAAAFVSAHVGVPAPLVRYEHARSSPSTSAKAVSRGR